MKTRSKEWPRTAPSVHQSVTIPVQLAIEVKRVARKEHLTNSQTPVLLARGEVDTEWAARARLNKPYRRFMAETDPDRKGEAEKGLIRAIPGELALAEDSIL